MNKYPKYKSSGVEWLETIPEHWSISRLKYLGELYGGLTGKSGVDFNNDENPKNKPYIPYTNIFNNTYISKDHYHYVSIDEGEIQNRVKKNDMFFLMSSETFKDLGKSCILIDDVDELYLNSFCKGYRIKDENIYPLFLNYQILGHLHREMISYEGKGFTRINLRQDKLNDLFVFYPPHIEQLQIVQFLDEKTGVIDKFISTKERKIELLKQQRTSLINEVITKGLNPKVKMKDSGVEWIGEIPEHWELIKIGYVSELLTGNPWKSELFDFDEGIKIVRGENVSEGFLRWGDRTRCWNYEVIKGNTYYLKEGDIIVSMDGSKVGKNYVQITRDDLPLLLHQRMCRIRCSNNIISNYLKFYIGSEMFRFYINISKTDPMIPHITQKDISDFQITIPPIKEQEQIVEHLDTRIKEIDDLVLMEKNKIDLLKEYRQSLISEVITGKIDVRTNPN
jgi:type I restriction enzyme S subunit